jgi:hypothetical protein
MATLQPCNVISGAGGEQDLNASSKCDKTEERPCPGNFGPRDILQQSNMTFRGWAQGMSLGQGCFTNKVAISIAPLSPWGMLFFPIHLVLRHSPCSSAPVYHYLYFVFPRPTCLSTGVKSPLVCLKALRKGLTCIGDW